MELVKQMMAYTNQNSAHKRNEFKPTSLVIEEVCNIVRLDLASNVKMESDIDHEVTIQIDADNLPFIVLYFNFLLRFIKVEFLFDYNLQLLETILKILRVKKIIQFTDTYELNPSNVSDYRELSELKQANINIEYTPYYQVFDDKFGFKENVSCIDALFNIGLDVKQL